MLAANWFVLTIAVIIFLPASAYGHGLGIDTISSVDVAGKEISVSVELPMYFDENEEQLTITAIDKESKENTKNVTFLIGLFHENEMIFRNYFFTNDGYLPIKIQPTQDNKITIHGEQDSLLGAWHETDSNPIQITGPLFQSGGLYTFEIQVRTIDEPTNIIEDIEVYYANLSIVETNSYLEKDSENNDVKFRMKSYYDEISSFQYDPELKQVSFEMPFDWSEKNISHIPVVHEEVHFPKDFSEFLTPSYVGKVNGVELFKSSVTIDDYTEEDERIVHFVLLQDHLRFLKNQIKELDETLPEKMIFTLSISEEVQFPITAFTKNEDFQVDLSWDPVNIQPDTNTKFVFTIRDGATGEPLRNSDYTFLIIQNGDTIYQTTGNAQVGGDFEEYTFTEEQTGPTIIKFENIRNTGQETEFGIVVVPEFGAIMFLILTVSVIGMIFATKRSSVIFH